MQKREYLYLLPLVLITCTVFSNALTGEFLYDDKPYITDNPQVTGETRLGAVFLQSTPPDQPDLGLYRPFFVLTLRLNHFLSGFKPSAFHGTNLFIHILATAALFFLIRRLSANPAGAFLGALLFAVHPVHVEAVTWIVGRAELLSCLFCLLAALMHFRTRPNPWLAVLEGVFFSAAILSKENAMAFPAVLWLLEYFTERERMSRLSVMKTLKGYWIYAVLVVGLFLLRYEVLGRLSPAIETAPFKDVGLPGRFEAALSSLAEYIRLFAFPHPLKIFYHISEIRDLNLSRWIILLASATLIVLAIRRKSRMLPWMLWVPFTLIPVLNVVPIGAVFAERFFYLPSVGACAALGIGMASLIRGEQDSRGTHISVWIPTAMALGFGIMTFARNPAFDNSYVLWKDATLKGEEFAFPHYNLGEAYFDKEIFEFQSPEVQGAVREFTESLRLKPDHPYAFSAHYRLGQYFQMKYSRVARETRYLRQAVDHYKESLRLAPPVLESKQKPALLLAQIPCVQGGFQLISLEQALGYLKLAESFGMTKETVFKVESALYALQDTVKKQTRRKDDEK
ncbi:MAG: hypothetical protein ABIK28_14945 [Planctomycetota bacterium]